MATQNMRFKRVKLPENVWFHYIGRVRLNVCAPTHTHIGRVVFVVVGHICLAFNYSK